MNALLRASLVVLLATGQVVAADVPATMRLDFYHSGNHENELFSLDEVVLEPLPWSGNMHRPLDTTLRGKYLFEIVDADDGLVSWSRSFSSIFGEWQTTGEARRMNRTFHESLRFPAPVSGFEVVLRKRGEGNRFEEVWRLTVNPGDYLVHRESAAYADDVVAILQNGDPATKVDLLLLGDGYTAEERGRFIATAREMAEVLFAASPFRERKDDFNVWALAPASAMSGISRPSTGTYRDTPVGATYDAFRSRRYILTFDNKAWRRIASSTPYDFVEILTNTETYGGGGIYGLFSTAAANNDWAPYLFVHEFGHHFAGLADEYYTSSVAYEPPETITEPYEPNVTALLDPETLKWKKLVALQTPLPTPWPKKAFETHSIAVQARREALRKADAPESELSELFRFTRDFSEALFADAKYRGTVGAFEGANYQAQGYYRPELNCLMFTRTDYFCSVCAAAIDSVIDEYTRPAGD